MNEWDRNKIRSSPLNKEQINEDRKKNRRLDAANDDMFPSF